MKPHRVISRIVCGCCLWMGSICLGSPAAVVDFESVPAGTVFGASNNDEPGQTVLTESGIQMSVVSLFVSTFEELESVEEFRDAEVGGFWAQLFPTQALELTNIGVVFDFSGLDFDVSKVTIEYNYFGAATNLSVNGAELFQMQSPTELPLIVAPGVFARVQSELISLKGPITTVRIGGQELAIDNIVAVPEPATALLLGLSGFAVLVRRKRRRCH